MFEDICSLTTDCLSFPEERAQIFSARKPPPLHPAIHPFSILAYTVQGPNRARSYPSMHQLWDREAYTLNRLHVYHKAVKIYKRWKPPAEKSCLHSPRVHSCASDTNRLMLKYCNYRGLKLFSSIYQLTEKCTQNSFDILFLLYIYIP